MHPVIRTVYSIICYPVSARVLHAAGKVLVGIPFQCSNVLLHIAGMQII